MLHSSGENDYHSQDEWGVRVQEDAGHATKKNRPDEIYLIQPQKGYERHFQARERERQCERKDRSRMLSYRLLGTRSH